MLTFYSILALFLLPCLGALAFGWRLRCSPEEEERIFQEGLEETYRLIEEELASLPEPERTTLIEQQKRRAAEGKLIMRKLELPG